MLLLVNIDGIETAIVGYAPGKGGEPMAIVPWQCPNGEFVPRAVRLSECHLLNLPEKLERRLRKQRKKKDVIHPGIPDVGRSGILRTSNPGD